MAVGCFRLYKTAWHACVYISHSHSIPQNFKLRMSSFAALRSSSASPVARHATRKAHSRSTLLVARAAPEEAPSVAPVESAPSVQSTCVLSICPSARVTARVVTRYFTRERHLLLSVPLCLPPLLLLRAHHLPRPSTVRTACCTGA